MPPRLFDTVLVANRGEIAVRVFRTLRRMGIRSVAVYSDADAAARHVREADVAVRLGPAPAAQSYLSVERLLEAAERTGAQAVHPGYGFLAENAAFARACADAGLVFIGPPPDAVEVMGDKIRAKLAVMAAGVPVVPGRTEPGMTDSDLVAAAEEVGYPVLLKPSAGGGGKGMRLVHDPAALPAEIAGARREAAASFGDDTLFVERFVLQPRHIEVQVMADAHGNVVHLGERECSLQRRHQKVVEEAPSALLDAATRERIGAAAVETARAVSYTGAGTVEFIVGADRPDEFFFMEMNTRLQVEHPVTELVTGLDLVELQVRVAAGEPLPFAQTDVRLDGHAVEVRVYAEDPAKGFLPTAGSALLVREPDGDGVRVDSGLVEGLPVATSYDPMLSKVMAWGPNRATALARLDGALARHVLLGITTNTGFLRRLITHPDVLAGRLDTGLVERELESLVSSGVPVEALVAYAVDRLLDAEDGLWGARDGWRVSEPAWTRWVLDVPGGTAELRLRRTATGWETGDGHAVRAFRDGSDLVVTVDGRTSRVPLVRDGRTTWLGVDGEAWPVAEHDPARDRAAGAGHGDTLRSPMPGTVVAVHVEVGQQVSAGQALVVVEAMKMEHTLSAPHDGVVAEVAVRAGQSVKVDQLLASVDPVEEGG